MVTLCPAFATGLNHPAIGNQVIHSVTGLALSELLARLTHLRVKIPARSVVGVCIGSANRDERRWERSEEFDIFRKHMPHISFAAGEHTCLGLHLARLETRVALECLLNRLTNVELVADGDAQDPHIHGQPFRSPNALPVTFGAK